MSAMTKLGNKSGDSVELPEETAKALFGLLKDVNEVVKTANKGDAADVEDVEEGEAMPPLPGEGVQDENLSLDSLDCPKVALEVIRDYALLPEDKRTADIPKPLERPIESVVTEGEMALLEKAASEKYLTPLLETALYLHFDQLATLCAAYAYQRIEKIAKEAPDIMEGAERIRQFLNVPNEWTEEEMGHLRKEMEFAKELDPNAY